jgi:hypothetical protein
MFSGKTMLFQNGDTQAGGVFSGNGTESSRTTQSPTTGDRDLSRNRNSDALWGVTEGLISLI